MQPGLFGGLESESSSATPERIGRASVAEIPKAAIFANAQGFMGDYDYTLNPYTGCSFGCAYCYAAFFVPDADKREHWGEWVEVKTRAEQEIRGKRRLKGTTVYMSSVTDPYQPIEAKIGLTRRIMELLAQPQYQPRLVIQTRSPLVTRDIDLFRQFEAIRVNMTITTDDDEIRKRFEPWCPSIERRFQAIEEVAAAGVKVSLCVTPMLPLKDIEAFGDRLAKIRAAVYVAQPFKGSQGAFAASTRVMARQIADDLDWSTERYREAFQTLRSRLPHLYEGREGFAPE